MPPSSLAPRDEFYGYELVRRLGEGGFGEVWLAENSVDGSRVALKFPRPDAARSIELLRREAANYRGLVRAMADLPSVERPPIVAILNDLTRHDPPALVLQYMEGGDLRAWMAERRERGGEGGLSFEESLPVVRDIAAALSFAHDHNLVHRDLSPENVLLDPESGRWKVSDFGLGARHAAEGMGALSLERSGQPTNLSTLSAGKFHYMAPEQFADGERVGPAADYYALGVVWAQ